MLMTRREALAGLGLLLTGALPSVAAEKPTAEKTPAADSATKAKVAPAEQIWQDLMDGNRRFREGKPRERTLVPTRQELAKGQAPRVIVLGCSDSRVPPSLVFDKSLGDLFVVRTAGNVADPVGLGSIEYAAEHLHSSLLVVLGHEKCGAVAAAASGGKVESRNLRAIISRINPALKPLREKLKGDELVRAGVEANAALVAETVVAKSRIVAELVEKGSLTVMKAIYRLESGEVSRLA